MTAEEYVARHGRYSIFCSAADNKWRVLDNWRIEWVDVEFPTRADAEMWVLLHN